LILSTSVVADSSTAKKAKPYSLLVLEKEEVVATAPSTQSVNFSSDGSKLYAINLEGMSVNEFD